MNISFSNILKIVLILLCVFVVSIGLTVIIYRYENKIKLLERSYSASQSVIKYYRLKNGTVAASHPVETYTVNQIKDGIVKGVLDEIKLLDLKPKNITTYAETVVKSEKQITTLLHDSIVNDTVQYQVFSYSDPYYTVFGVAGNDTQHVSIQSTDTIKQVVHKKRKYPWLWIFSPKIYEQIVTCKNPNNNIVFERFIEIK